MTDSVADLFVTLNAVTAPMIAGFAEGGAAGEDMAATISTAQAEIAASFAAGVDACTAEVEAMVAGQTEIAASATASAETIAASQAELAASYGTGATAADVAASQTSAAFAAASAAISASLAEIEASEAACAASTEAMAATMSGASAEMGAASVASATFKASLSDSAAMVGMSSGQLLGLGAAAAVVAGVTVHMAADFESSTTRLVTSAGELQSNLDADRQGLLTMAGQVGDSAEALSKALYTINSGGQHGADGLTVLRAAAEGAKTENASLTTVADAVTSALTDYHLKASDAATVTSQLVAATGAGKTTFEELAGSMSAVLPVASADHVSLQDVLGDLASMTIHGMSAQQAAQNLTDVMNHMASPTQAQSKELAILGINAQQLSADLGTKGLSGTLEEIAQSIQKNMGGSATKVILDLGTALKGLPPEVQDLGAKVLDGSISMGEFTKATKGLTVEQAGQVRSFAALANTTHVIGSEQISGQQVMQSYSGALAKATGDSTGLRTALMLTGENSGTTAKAIAAVSGASTEAGNHVAGWGEIQSTFNQKMAEAGAGANALAISVGEKLLPVVSTIAGWFATASQFLSAHQAIATALAVVIGGIVVVAFLTLAAAVIAATWEFLLAGAVIGAVVAGIVWLVNLIVDNWGAISGWFAGLWNGVKTIFSDAVNWVVGVFQDWYPLILGVLTGGILLLPALIFKYWDQITGFFSRIWDDVVGGFENAGASIGDSVDGIDAFFLGIGETIGSVVQWFEDLPGNIESALSSLYTTVTQPFIDAWNAVVAFFSQGPRKIGEELGRGAAELVKAGANLLISINNGIVSAATTVFNFFSTTLPNAIATSVIAAGTWLLKTGISIVTGLRDGIVSGYQAVVQFFTVTLPNAITTAVAASATWLLKTGISIVAGLQSGITNGYQAVTAWFAALPGRVVAGFGAANTWLLQKGKDLWHGFWDDGVVPLWTNTVAWFTALPGHVKDFFKDAGQWLFDAGKNLIQGLWDGATSLWNGFTGWISDITGGAVDGFNKGLGNNSPSVKTHESGVNLMQGLQNGVASKRDEFMTMIDQYGPDVIKGFSAAGQWLVNAGYNVVMGLWNGIQSVASWLYNAVTSWASGIVTAAKNALGIASPSTHMHEAGGFLAQGLANGIDANRQIAAAAAARMTQGVIDAAKVTSGQKSMLVASMAAIGGDGASLGGVAAGVSGQIRGQVLTGAGGAGGTTTIVNVAPVIQGHVWTTKDLVNELQSQLLQHGIRNSGNGLNYGFGGGR